MRISVFVDGVNFFYIQKRLSWWIYPKKGTPESYRIIAGLRVWASA
jgi:hypothetical protein